MIDFDIWIEGHHAQGSRSTAKKIAAIKAATFKEACVEFSKTPKAKGFGNFDAERLTFWGCRLFDNEESARGSFG